MGERTGDDAGTPTASGAAGADAGGDGTGTGSGGYGGLFGAFPYAFRRSESTLFRLYAALGGLLALLLALGFGFALVVQVANTLGGPGGTFTFSRALFIVLGLLVVGPLLAPVLFVARHHRRAGSDPRYDRLLAGSGFLFLAALYVGTVITVPPAQQEVPPAVIAPLVEFLYGLPPALGLLPPLATALGIYLVHRWAR